MAKGFFSGLFGKKKADESGSPKETAAETPLETAASPEPVSAEPAAPDAVPVSEAAPVSDMGAAAKNEAAQTRQTPPVTPPPDHAQNVEAETSAAQPPSHEAVDEPTPAPSFEPSLDPDMATEPDGKPDEKPDGDSVPPSEPEKKKGFFSRLKQGLSKTSGRLTEGVTAIFTKKKLDDEMLEELENLLISADLGLPAATRLTTALATSKFDKEITDLEVRQALAEEVASTLRPLARPLSVDTGHKPHVILMTGVNGAGKTTTIGKLASTFKAQGKSVMLAAGDTFRAAAIEQLTVWGERTNTPVIARKVGADAAGLAFDALKEAQAQNIDVLMIDTAGRLQNRAELMDELAKIVRVIRKLDATAPHDTVLVLDATVGQNALSQVEAFKQTADVTGLVMTKLDGTARGGVLVALADKFALPVHYIGVGENIDDLQMFDADSFANALADVE